MAWLLKDPLSQVVGLVGGKARVIDSDGHCALILRSPEAQDALRLGIFLGEDSLDTA